VKPSIFACATPQLYSESRTVISSVERWWQYALVARLQAWSSRWYPAAIPAAGQAQWAGWPFGYAFRWGATHALWDRYALRAGEWWRRSAANVLGGAAARTMSDCSICAREDPRPPRGAHQTTRCCMSYPAEPHLSHAKWRLTFGSAGFLRSPERLVAVCRAGRRTGCHR